MTEGRPPLEGNAERFESEQLVRDYESDGLTPAEGLMVERWIPRGAKVLDLGVGTGRTTAALAAIASDYVGVDLSRAMVARARERHPGHRFEVGDAAKLDAFDSGAFDAVVFSYNGLDYLHPEPRRRAALQEIRRVLAPGGVAILSTHNPRAVVRTAAWDRRGDRPLRAAAIAAWATARAVGHALTGGPFWRGVGYQRDWVQGLLTYFATPRRFVEELRRAGFEVLDQVPGNHPRGQHPWSSPWTYVAALRPREERPTVEVVRGPAALDDVAEEWDRLAGLPGTAVFQTRAWVTTWQRCLVPGARLTLLVARDPCSREVTGLLPVAGLRRELHHRIPITLRYLGIAGSGSGAADHLGPLARDEETAAALFRELRRLAAGRPVLLENLHPRWSGLAAAELDARSVRSTACLAARRDPGGSFSDAWSAKMRKNVRRRARQLAQLGVEPRWVGAGPEFDDALGELREVHVRRWRTHGGAGLFDERRERFLAQLAAAANPDVRILLLERDGRTVAGLLALRHGDTLSVYKTGWDPDYARLSPGIALGVEAMRWAEEHGVLVVDYLRGERTHKRDLGCTPVHEPTLLASRGPAARVLAVRERLSADGMLPTPVRLLRRLASTA